MRFILTALPNKIRFMRYEEGHKQATRQRIVETAAARFRRDGIENVGVADVMAEAGLTHGGFYSHFASKEDLVKATVAESAVHSRTKAMQRMDAGGLEKWIRMYLRPEHRDHPEWGCSIAALAQELARHPESTRTGLNDWLKSYLELATPHLPAGLSPEARRKLAFGVFGTVVGALQMARAVTDPKLSEEILEAGIQSALVLTKVETLTA